jgi:hypothetical protein
MRVLFALVLLLPAAALAQKHEPEKKRTTINFEDELIQGSKLKPDIFVTESAPAAHNKRLIHLRDNFLSEMRETAAAVRTK